MDDNADASLTTALTVSLLAKKLFTFKLYCLEQLLIFLPVPDNEIPEYVGLKYRATQNILWFSSLYTDTFAIRFYDHSVQ